MEKDKKGYSLSEYMLWRGDLSFEQSPLNEVDNAILSELAYLDCSKVMEPMNPEGVTLREVYRRIMNGGTYRFLTIGEDDPEFIRLAAVSRRFGTLMIRYYSDILDDDRLQFAAMHFSLNPRCDYVAFRGTDNSLIGWRENFMISFRHTQSQSAAADYLLKTMEEGKKYYVGGHSKGGNHAVFAVSHLDERYQKQVIRVFDNDGPGFSKDVFDLARIGSINHMVTKIVPSYDVIGQLFRRPVPDTRIISSTASAILQHDPLSWRCEGPQFLKEESLDPDSTVITESFNTWVEQVKPSDREQFVSDLFDSLSIKGARRLDEIRLDDVPDLLRNIFDSSGETRMLFNQLRSIFLDNVTKEAADRMNSLVEKQFRKKQSAGKEVKDKK